MKVDTLLMAPPADIARRAEELAATGVDGLFTFEGPHDVFLPLALAASTGCDLYTNVAIAFPRSPMHLAHLAWDLSAQSGGFAPVSARRSRPTSSAATAPPGRARSLAWPVAAIRISGGRKARLAFERAHPSHAHDPGLRSRAARERYRIRSGRRWSPRAEADGLLIRLSLGPAPGVTGPSRASPAHRARLTWSARRSSLRQLSKRTWRPAG